MNGRFASLHAGLLLRERPPAPPASQPSAAPVPLPPAAATTVVRPFPTVAAPRPQPQPTAASESRPRRRSFTVRLDEVHSGLLQRAKLRFGLSGQRLLVLALERLMASAGR